LLFMADKDPAELEWCDAEEDTDADADVLP
jgi:hypothetical protein